MRAVSLRAPREIVVEEVERPSAGPGQVVLDVERVGLCGTDVELFSGEIDDLPDWRFPQRLGHEWCGRVVAVGEGVDASWIGRRATADTMLGCGTCARCLGGRQHVCETRSEIGLIRWPGALAEQLAVPASALLALPDSVDSEAGALVEPGGNAMRAVRGAALVSGDRLLVIGTGAIGLLSGLIARAAGAEVHLLGMEPASLEFAATLGFAGVWGTAAGRHSELPGLAWDAVIDASNGETVPARAVELVEPAGRVVFIGLATRPSLVDTRLLALKDVTAVGVLSASGGLAAAIDHYASGLVDPRPLVGATVGLDQVAEVLAGWRPSGTGRTGVGPGPKILVDPRR
jgi:2-desacetyl-2-hydroxyethyl bacteriochlorophyllide A dehydrogenase